MKNDDEKEKEFEVYITKYALTKGIFKKNAKTSYSGLNNITVKVGTYLTYYHGEGKEWHRTRESALARAIHMRRRKIESLEKQIEKLENMTFEVKEDE